MEMTSGGVVHDYNDVDGLKKRISEYFVLYQSGQLKGNAGGIEKFTRRHMAAEFASLLNSLTTE
jgi:hypothetical protein